MKSTDRKSCETESSWLANGMESDFLLFAISLSFIDFRNFNIFEVHKFIFPIMIQVKHRGYKKSGSFPMTNEEVPTSVDTQSMEFTNGL